MNTSEIVLTTGFSPVLPLPPLASKPNRSRMVLKWIRIPRKREIIKTIAIYCQNCFFFIYQSYITKRNTGDKTYKTVKSGLKAANLMLEFFEITSKGPHLRQNTFL
jgi:hypothetical protein